MTDREQAVNKKRRDQRRMRFKEKKTEVRGAVVLADMFEIPTACLLFNALLTSQGVNPPPKKYISWEDTIS